ncbi:MAG: PhoX family phosphatase [Wenzhouxiangellaceae bacterium]
MKLDDIPRDETGSSNRSDNRPFHDVLNTHLSRRTVLTGSLAVAGSTFMAANPAMAQLGGLLGGGLINFTPIAIADGSGPNANVSSDYQFQVLIPWGDPLEPSGPAFKFPPNADDQALQIGGGHDGMTFFPAPPLVSNEVLNGLSIPNNSKGMLAINHEFITNFALLGKDVPENIQEVRTSQHAHGVAVVAIERIGGVWQQVESPNARRIHVNSPVRFSGPVAGSEYIQTPNGNVPLGTVNNCANGETPWGTYLTCEENFNGYFGTADENGNPVLDTTWEPTEAQQRYGFSEFGFAYFWHKYDRRFNLADPDYRNEENRFGWIVEIDPHDGTQVPVKRTALGRFKHEGATFASGDGNRAVVYMGDDERFDYIYKYVSSDDWEVMRANGISPLDEGTLYVARFNDDGTGEWLPLTMDVPALAARFDNQAELLTFTRIAADIVGATPMDRPEWSSIGPDGQVYFTLTNNTRREPGQENAANPLAPNPDGHIIRFDDGNRTGTSFSWDIFLFAADTRDTDHVFTDPDGLFIDKDGRVFIETDGGQPNDLNNQLLVTDVNNPGNIRRLFTGPAGCEITGFCMTPDRRTAFINVQHPGNGDPTVSNFPAPFDGVTQPRDATIVLTRKNGGIIGS